MKRSLGTRTLLFPTPVMIIGSYDAEGKPNVMNAAWGGVCCSRPPCIAVSLRKATYTYSALVARRAFTVNIPSEALLKEADYFGIASGRQVDKFARTGLTPVRSTVVDAPYIEEFPLVLECRVLHVLEIGLHTQFVGEVMDIKAEEGILTGKGLVDAEKLRPALYDTETRVYRGFGPILGEAFSIGKKFTD